MVGNFFVGKFFEKFERKARYNNYTSLLCQTDLFPYNNATDPTYADQLPQYHFIQWYISCTLLAMSKQKQTRVNIEWNITKFVVKAFNEPSVHFTFQGNPLTEYIEIDRPYISLLCWMSPSGLKRFEKGHWFSRFIYKIKF